MQEKWLFTSSGFKEENKVSIPPFSFFTHLVCREAKARDDPSFKLSSSSHAFIHNERPLYKDGASKVPVLVHQTLESRMYLEITSSIQQI